MPAPTTTTTTQKIRRAVTVAVFLSIIIAAIWSIANIAEAANYYHQSPLSIGLGLAFGLANAISVYALATSRTRHSRMPAIIGTVVFGLGSAVIQYHLYADLLNVATIPALAFASLGPLTEALLAWLEAGLHKEDAIDTRDRILVDLESEIAEARERAETAETEQKRSAKAAREATDELERLRDHAYRTESAAPAAAQEASAAAKELSANEKKWIEQFVTIIQGQPGEIWTTDGLAEAADCSQRTAQRYAALAVEAGRLTSNGDGGYHAT